jgi:hypothetical protein
LAASFAAKLGELVGDCRRLGLRDQSSDRGLAVRQGIGNLLALGTGYVRVCVRHPRRGSVPQLAEVLWSADSAGVVIVMLAVPELRSRLRGVAAGNTRGHRLTRTAVGGTSVSTCSPTSRTAAATRGVVVEMVDGNAVAAEQHPHHLRP